MSMGQKQPTGQFHPTTACKPRVSRGASDSEVILVVDIAEIPVKRALRGVCPSSVCPPPDSGNQTLHSLVTILTGPTSPEGTRGESFVK